MNAPPPARIGAGRSFVSHHESRGGCGSSVASPSASGGTATRTYEYKLENDLAG
jgi:hypothetical protein